jgi:LPXTG-site transpeptidase (sortase) family protein
VFKVLYIVGNVFVTIGIIVLVLIFWPVAKEEINYDFNQLSHVKYVVGNEQVATFEKPLIPINTGFSIIIPKIAAIAPIIDDVDPSNQIEYLKALKEGVAHARGTAYPGTRGNVYLFAHSTDAFYNIGKYNAVFFLLGKLTKGDEVFIFYRGTQIKYIVDQVKVVSPNDSKYLTDSTDEKILTLQTCYPPGTTYERLIVIAKQVE